MLDGAKSAKFVRDTRKNVRLSPHNRLIENLEKTGYYVYNRFCKKVNYKDIPGQGNVKGECNLTKYRGFALPITGLKSEIRIPACHANMVRAEHRSSNKRIRSGTILNAPKGIAAGQMTKTFRERIQYLQGLGMF